jgi:SAM-dependent methyltransferase
MLPQRLRSIVNKLVGFGQRPAPVERSVALEEEIQFWRDWFATRGMDWPEDYRPRFDPDQPIQEHVAIHIDRLEADRVHILDVGAGPLTKLGKKHLTKQLLITPTDLLADSYDRLLEELSIDPLIRTIYADVERLAEQFGSDAFDIVHGQNCIDHTANPLRAIEQMLEVSKPEGFVVLFHAENEGRRNQYTQLHQWDFTCEDGDFVIRDRNGRRTNVTRRLAAVATVECTRVPDDGDYAILTGIRKHGA